MNGVVAFIASAVVIVSAAYVPDLSAAIQAAFPGHYRLVVGGLVLAAIAVATIAVAFRIRTDRRRRFALLAVGVGAAAAYFARFRTGNVDVDVVEAFHFVEYGALAMLFYRAWRRYGDARRFALPLLAGLAVGVLDESLQWFLASRVGEAHDVMMDLVAVTCGLFVVVALDPPPSSALTLDRAAAAHVGGVAAVVVILFAAFFNAVHVGYEIEDPEIGTFRSRYDAATLQRMAAERVRRWSNGLPVRRGRFAREDQYLTEALWHVRERNDALNVGDTLTAWRENRVLEKFYAPLVELPAVNREYRWPPEQRALTAAAAPAHGVPYVSQAEAVPIYVPKIKPGLILRNP